MDSMARVSKAWSEDREESAWKKLMNEGQGERRKHWRRVRADNGVNEEPERGVPGASRKHFKKGVCDLLCPELLIEQRRGALET